MTFHANLTTSPLHGRLSRDGEHIIEFQSQYVNNPAQLSRSTTKPPSTGIGGGIAGLMCGAVTFLVPPQCRVRVGVTVYFVLKCPTLLNLVPGDTLTRG